MKSKLWLIKPKIFSCLFALAAVNALAVDQNKTKDESIDLGQVIIEATRTEVDVQKYAGSVGILTPKDMENSTNVIDALGDIPGIDIDQKFGREVGKEIRIRGFSTWGDSDRIIIKQDGVGRDPVLYSNQISTFRSDVDILKRVEVTKGASSILHGSGAIGGIVNMTTKDARDYLSDGKEFGAMLGYRTESNHMHSYRGGIYGDFDDFPIDFLLYGKKAYRGTTKLADGGPHQSTAANKQYAYNDEEIQDIFFKIGADLEDHRVQFSVFDYKDDLKTFWQSMQQNSANFPVIGDLNQRDYTFDYFYNPNELVNLNFKAYKSEANYFRYWAAQDSDTDLIDNRWGLNLKNNSKFNTGFLSHNFVIGGDFQDRQEKASSITHSTGVNNDSYLTHPNKWQDVGGYIQDIISINDLDVTLGGRYDRYERKVKRDGQEKFTDDRFSPRIALGYTLFDRLTLLGGYSESFRAPTPHEAIGGGPVNRWYWIVPNQNLKAETAKEYEIGFSFADQALLSNDDYFNFKIIYFNGKFNNFIDITDRTDLGTPPPNRLFDPTDPNLDDQIYAQYINIAKAKRNGWEISTNYEISDFRFGASYETLKIYDAQTKQPIRKHANKAIAKFGYTPFKNLDFDLRVSHWFKPPENPKYLNQAAYGTRYLMMDKSVTITDAKLKYKVGRDIPLLDGAILGFGVNNIFDKQYINANAQATSGHVGTGRNYWFDIEMRF